MSAGRSLLLWASFCQGRTEKRKSGGGEMDFDEVKAGSCVNTAGRPSACVAERLLTILSTCEAH